MFHIEPQFARVLLASGGFLALAKFSTLLLRKAKQLSNKKHKKNCQRIFKKLYRNVNAFEISLDYRDQEKIKGDEFTYGEIMFTSFAEILSLAFPKPGDIFYDLGCGSGKAVFTAAVFFPNISSRGIELLDPLYDLCNNLKETFSELASNDPYFKEQNFDIEFFKSDHLEHDFSDGNIVFINATCFKDKDWEAMVKKLEELPSGARVISSSKTIDSKKFTLRHAGSHLMTWGMNSVFIYQKVSK